LNKYNKTIITGEKNQSNVLTPEASLKSLLAGFMDFEEDETMLGVQNGHCC
jgi:hypothetical protein